VRFRLHSRVGVAALHGLGGRAGFLGCSAQSLSRVAGAVLGVCGFFEHACKVFSVAGGLACLVAGGALGLALHGAGGFGGVAHGFSGRLAFVGVHFGLQALRGFVHLLGGVAQHAVVGCLQRLRRFAGALCGVADGVAVGLGLREFLHLAREVLQLLRQRFLALSGLLEVGLAFGVGAFGAAQVLAGLAE